MLIYLILYVGAWAAVAMEAIIPRRRSVCCGKWAFAAGLLDDAKNGALDSTVVGALALTVLVVDTYAVCASSLTDYPVVIKTCKMYLRLASPLRMLSAVKAMEGTVCERSERRLQREPHSFQVAAGIQN